jgi:hypothetical protein
MAKFKLPRKKKKQFKKDCYPFFDMYYNSKDRVANWEWFYFKRRVCIRGLGAIVGDLKSWYIQNNILTKDNNRIITQNMYKYII